MSKRPAWAHGFNSKNCFDKYVLGPIYTKYDDPQNKFFFKLSRELSIPKWDKTSTSWRVRAFILFFLIRMIKCNQKMYKIISDYDFARIREGLTHHDFSEYLFLNFLHYFSQSWTGKESSGLSDYDTAQGYWYGL